MSSKLMLQLVCFVILFVPRADGQSDETPNLPTIFDRAYVQQVSNIKIDINLDTLRANKLNDNEIIAHFKGLKSGGEVVLDLPVKVSVRSKSRRRYCSFPPIKLDFSKPDLDTLGLARQDDYKIVTHCLDESKDESVLLKEYLIYQLYQIISPLSLRALLVDIEYHCTARDTSLKRKAILLESFDELALNQKGEPCNCMGTPMDSLDRLQYELVALLQFMIGNSDMDHRVERNVKLLKPMDGKPWLPVAYDFDYACLVNAPYVYTTLPDNRAIRPKYLGLQENAEQLKAAKEIFIGKKKEIINYVKEFDGLSKSDLRTSLQYIKDFYSKIESYTYAMPYKF